MGFETPNSDAFERSGKSYAEYTPMELEGVIKELNVSQLADLQTALTDMQNKLNSGASSLLENSSLEMPEEGKEATASLRDGKERNLNDISIQKAQTISKLEMVKEAIRNKM